MKWIEMLLIFGRPGGLEHYECEEERREGMFGVRWCRNLICLGYPFALLYLCLFAL
jgi:hypothetical protein